jgi:hypothetical protein
MTEKRNPVKQIMSAVHKDARAGKIDLATTMASWPR